MSRKKRSENRLHNLYCIRSKKKRNKRMLIMFEFEFPNEYVGDEPVVLFHYDVNSKQYVYDNARDRFDEFFEYVVDAYEFEEVKEWYEHAKKCEEFKGSKDIPKSC